MGYSGTTAETEKKKSDFPANQSEISYIKEKSTGKRKSCVWETNIEQKLVTVA